MTAKIRIYTTDYCPHCTRAKRLLEQKGVSFEEIDVTRDTATRQKIEDQTGWMTVPMIFIGDEFIGGADDLYALEESGELDRKLQPEPRDVA
ncbi:MAG: glutaredoxin 3 [Candidatus Omnitrophica bacterium]|nr:glutaredoxin 3 [Candidatus Omnitrophota bacterium]MDD5671637.1 glutaredoxin 3 [Candidatus Omnitrophota bacterium]